MRSSSTSLYVFGTYLILIPGLGLMCCPDTLLDLFQLEYDDQLWIARMVGLLTFCIGIFEICIAKYEVAPMYKVTVYLRYIAAAFMVGLWVLDQVGMMILMFAFVDFLGATWTLLTLSDSKT